MSVMARSLPRLQPTSILQSQCNVDENYFSVKKENIHLLWHDVKHLGSQIYSRQLLSARQHKMQSFEYLVQAQIMLQYDCSWFMTWSLVASFWQPAQAEDDSSFIFLNNLRIQTGFLFTLLIMSYFDILFQKLAIYHVLILLYNI